MTEPADTQPLHRMQGEPETQVEQDRQLIREARAKGPASLLGAFVKLSGPGWLQSAITLGGGSLAGSLYLGVLAGTDLLWLQPLAMILGVIMLSAIAYVTLSTRQRPFEAIRLHVNPVLAWAWAIGTMLANFVWCMPQFTLGESALTQNLAPGLFAGMSETSADLACVAILFSLAAVVSWFYESGGRGIKLFELILKLMVGVVVISFFGVIIKMLASGTLDFGRLLAGFVPDVSLLLNPAEAFREPIAAAGEFSGWWREQIVTEQQRRMITTVGTAVGINMTFLLPYSMLARGWGRDFRGLATFDLSTGLLIPFVVATTCVVVAAATQFHASYDEALVAGEVTDDNRDLQGSYAKQLAARVKAEVGAEAYAAMSADETAAAAAALPAADRRLAAMLVTRDARHLAVALRPLMGERLSGLVFGIGVFAMAVSTIIILMLINGFVVCEMLGRPGDATIHRVAAFACAAVGALGPFAWKEASFYLAVPTSMFGYAMLPIAYITFFCLMNSRTLLGEHMPTGLSRVIWNTLMGVACTLTVIGSFWAIYKSAVPWVGFAIVGGLLVVALSVHFAKLGTLNEQAARRDDTSPVDAKPLDGE